MPDYSPPAHSRDWRITLLVDDPDAWIAPWAEALAALLSEHHRVRLCHDQDEIGTGDFCFLLGCTRKVRPDVLARNAHTLVVHESDLPRGRGFSPVQWQVLEGKGSIPVCLFEAVEEADAGPVYLRTTMELEGHELWPEIRRKQGQATIGLCLDFLRRWPDVTATPQTGTPTRLPKRTEKDDELDPHQSLAAQFDRLRIADNERYPAWFTLRGRRYRLLILPGEEPAEDDTKEPPCFK